MEHQYELLTCLLRRRRRRVSKNESEMNHEERRPRRTRPQGFNSMMRWSSSCPLRVAVFSLYFWYANLSVVNAQSGAPSQSSIPTFVPTVSMAPSTTPTESLAPTSRPTFSPSSIPSVSLQPTAPPTLSETPTTSPQPSAAPTQSNVPTQLPSSVPSLRPTVSSEPSAQPTRSMQPSNTPTISSHPSVSPSVTPTTSSQPSAQPSSTPSKQPTATPSNAPSSIPTLSTPLVESRSFRQQFLLSEQEFNATAGSIVTLLFESITDIFHPQPQRVTTTCEILGQTPFPCFESDQQCVVSGSSLPITSLFSTDVDYSCTWSSVVTEVEGSAVDFELYVDQNTDTILSQMQDLSLPVLNVFGTRPIAVEEPPPPTGSPSISAQPTTATPTLAPTGTPSVSANPTRTPHPTVSPTQSSRPTTTTGPSTTPSVTPSLSVSPSVSAEPSVWPSLSPSALPSSPPSLRPSGSPTRPPSPPPTRVPTRAPSTADPTRSPLSSNALADSNGGQSDSGQGTTVIVVVVVVAVVATLVALVAWFWRRRKSADPYYYEQNEAPVVPDQRQNGATTMAPWPVTTKRIGSHDIDSDIGVAIVSPSDSLVSRQSLLSVGESGLGDESDIEADNTRNLQDEFDQFKDQNIEQLRSDVEGNVSGFEGIMSAAVTKALMGDDYPHLELSSELTWGCSANATGADIEASVLYEVNAWLIRKENASVDQKRAFMQDILNRMVSSVRFGVLPAEDASRTIHESAALLGLQLAHQLPMTTIIISGMRKTSGPSQMKAVLREFGELDTVAAASGQRGFGIVRFRNPKSVDRVMRRYRNGEIVIQDVAIQMKFLTPSGQVESGKR